MGTQQASQQHPKGTRPHGNGIQIKFKPRGHKSYCYETLPWNPSPANIEKAGKLRQNIVDAIRHGVFRYAEFFPDSEKAQQQTVGTFSHYAQSWLDRPDNDWKEQSRYKFKGVLNRVWMPSLHDIQIRGITHTQLLSALRVAVDEFVENNDDDKEPSQSTYNDWLLCVRGVFETAILGGALTRANNPAAELKNKKRPKKEVDPFDDEEREAIIADIYKNNGLLWGAWFELGFFTGMRYPSEPSALLWQKVDQRKGEFRVDQIRTRTGVQNTTKTSVTRTVKINSRAKHALLQAKKVTGFKGEWIFVQDSGEPIGEGKAIRKMWRASLKRLKIRYRDQYNMRHSYASWGLSNGLNPAFMASQLGHSIEEFFRTYATWIGAAHTDLQMELMERAISQNVAQTGRAVAQKT